MRYNPDIVIRGETDADICPIENVTIAAFKSLAISNQTEQFIIKALRAAHALTISLVAGLTVEDVPSGFFFVLSFDGRVPEGVATFHEGFKADGDSWPGICDSV